MTAAQQTAANDTAAMLRDHFDLQRREYLAAPNPDYQQRKQDLQHDGIDAGLRAPVGCFAALEVHLSPRCPRACGA